MITRAKEIYIICNLDLFYDFYCKGVHFHAVYILHFRCIFSRIEQLFSPFKIFDLNSFGIKYNQKGRLQTLTTKIKIKKKNPETTKSKNSVEFNKRLLYNHFSKYISKSCKQQEKKIYNKLTMGKNQFFFTSKFSRFSEQHHGTFSCLQFKPNSTALTMYMSKLPIYRQSRQTF